MDNQQGGFDGVGEQKSEEKKYKDKNIVSVTIKQILDSDLNDNQIVIDGKSTEFVRVVAMVTSVESASTKLITESAMERKAFARTDGRPKATALRQTIQSKKIQWYV